MRDGERSGDKDYESVTTVTVGLIQEASDNLDWLVENIPLKTADVINRAITIYAYLEKVQREGAELFIKHVYGIEKWTFK